MGGVNSQPIQLEPAPGFQKRKANSFPGYEKYDFGGYEIWGPYKKTPIPGPFGISNWEPRNRVVDGALVLEKCSQAESMLRRPQGSTPAGRSLIRWYTTFSTKPNVGSDKPACYEDNATLTSADDGEYYIHYKHPMFARFYSPPLFQVSGLIPTMIQSSAINKAKTPQNIAAALQHRGASDTQGLLETVYLIGKSKMALNKMNVKSVNAGIFGPLNQAVRIISTQGGLFNASNRTLKGGKKRRGTRRNK